MSTRITVPHPRRLESLFWLAAALLVSLALSGAPTHASRCPDQDRRAAAASGPAATPAAAKSAPMADADRPHTDSASTGLDLEVRIWNVRIEFPWLKSLPLTPGRHVVLSLFETDADR
jgi:hypothetical protein